MKMFFGKVSFMTLIIVLVMVFIGCTPKPPEMTVEVIHDPSKMAPPVREKGDYFERGVVLAAFLYEDNFSLATFFPARIITEAGADGKYEVEALVGSRRIEKGTTHRTKNVILKSHPAKKKELRRGRVVLYCGDETANDESKLKIEKWNRGVVVKTDELFKHIIEVGYYNNLTEGVVKQYRVHMRNVRISDNPVIKGPQEEEE